MGGKNYISDSPCMQLLELKHMLRAVYPDASGNWRADSSPDGCEPSFTPQPCYCRIRNNWFHVRAINLHSWKCFPLTRAILILTKHDLFTCPCDNCSGTKMYERLPLTSMHLAQRLAPFPEWINSRRMKMWCSQQNKWSLKQGGESDEVNLLKLSSEPAVKLIN